MKRKKILLHTDFSLVKSGLGGFSRELLTYLYKLDKYTLIHYVTGIQWSHPELKRTPWKSVGCLPDNPQEIEAINRDPHQARNASYGSYYIDRIIQEEKPDIYIGSNDPWSFEGYWDKAWFSQINSLLHITIDSTPLWEPAVQNAHKIKNYWMWSNFAEKEFHRLGFKHVKTVHGTVNTNDYYRLKDIERKELRKKHNISEDAFIIGFVFRNQLRKNVDKLIEGYKIWKTQNSQIKNTYLLLSSSLNEGWNIPRFAEELGVPHKEILVPYICRSCKEYQIKSYDDRKSPYVIDDKGMLKIGDNGKPLETKIETSDKDCPFCGTQKSQITPNVGLGITERELNEVYNLMDVYCHPMTSGGQERPIQEAKLAELITLVTPYSCGLEMCEDGAGSFPLDYAEYREFGTQFIKSATYPSSIAKQINKVYTMDIQKRREMGKQARKWVLDNFSIEVVGKKFEEFIDSCPEIDYSKVSFGGEAKNPNAVIPEGLSEHDWIITLYKEILRMNVNESDSGYENWARNLKSGMTRKQIHDYFINVALTENQKNNKVNFEDLLDKNGRKRLLLVGKESAGDILYISCLLKSFKESYPDHDIYFACKNEFFELLEGNPYIHKILPYINIMDSEIAMTGQGVNLGYFDVYVNLTISTQYVLNYLTNNNLNLQLR